MVIRGFDRNTMEKFFNFILNDNRVDLFKNRLSFSTRVIGHTGKPNIPTLSDEQIEKEGLEFRNFMALLYIRTFYGKAPSDFLTESYREECAKFNAKINSLSNSAQIRKKIEQCLDKNSVDYVGGELPDELFYDKLKFVDLSMDDSNNTNIFINTQFITQTRIYINPSQKDYSHLMKFLFTRASQSELDLKAKTRLPGIRYGGLDNLVLYTSASDCKKVIAILEEYGRLYPDKVSGFGDSLEGLGRSGQDWYGFGFEPQRGLKGENNVSTYNSFMDDIFKNYIFPAVLLDDFSQIASKYTPESLIPIFYNPDPAKTTIFKDEQTAKDFIITLKVKGYRNLFLKTFCDLSYVKQESEKFTETNTKLPKDKLEGKSPKQLRSTALGQLRDENLLSTQKISIKLYTGKIVEVPREAFSILLRNNDFRTLVTDFYRQNPDLIEEKISQMESLFQNVGKNLPYLDEKHPFISDDMAKVLISDKTQLPV